MEATFRHFHSSDAKESSENAEVKDSESDFKDLQIPQAKDEGKYDCSFLFFSGQVSTFIPLLLTISTVNCVIAIYFQKFPLNSNKYRAALLMDAFTVRLLMIIKNRNEIEEKCKENVVRL